MSRKLPFKVIHASGSDEEHPGCELEVHGPLSKGWQSSRFCIYPQEIVLALKETAKVVKLQVLSHQFNISSKIEVFIAYPHTNKGTSPLNGVKFRRLGYVPLSDNESTNFKARELKSINLNADGQFIKLLIHKNYVNKVNLYNQVSIIAINILGQSLSRAWDSNGNYLSRTEDIINSYVTNSVDVNLNSSPVAAQARYEGGKYISPLDDLAFDMYQDPETAQLIRKLEDRKVQAVLEERYDYARKLKNAMSDLYKVGERLGKYEIEKRRAVEMEDYELAKTKKLQSDEYRLHVYKQLDVFDLLELKGSKYENKLQQKTNKPVIFESPPPPLSSAPFSKEIPKSISPPIGMKSIEEVKLPPVSNSPIIAAEVNESVAPDDRPLPALQGKPIAEILEEPIQKPQKEDEDTDLPTLTEKEESEANTLIEIFGMIVTRKLFSKNWKFRQESLTNLQDELENPTEKSTENSPSSISRAVVTALKKGLNDKVYVVLQDSVELLKKLLLEYLPNNGLSKTELSRAVEKLLPVMIKRTSDNVPRSRNMMFDTVVELASKNDVKALNIVPSIISEPIKGKKQPPKQIKSQIDLIKRLIPDFGIDNKNGFQLDRVMKILHDGIEHPAGQVRDSSLECIIEIYKIIKEPVKKYFPSDDATSRKNPMYVKLFDAFDKADGKLTQAERKAASIKKKETAEKRQKDEVKALQTQLEQLRTMAQEQINAIPTKSEKVDEPSTSSDVNNPEKLSVKMKGSRKTPSTPSLRKQLKAQTPRKDLAMGSQLTMDRLCIFCGEQNEDFTDGQLDVHYWKSCPMLKRCHTCTEVVEISEMNEHLLTECENKDKFLECKICGNVIAKEEEEEHVGTPQCKQNSKNSNLNKCPLCFIPVGESDEKWKTHLIKNCKINSERLNKNNEKTKTYTKKKSERGRGRGKHGGISRGGSKIPSRTPVKKM